MLKHARPWRRAACLATLLCALLPATGYTQALDAKSSQRVSLTARLVLATEDLERQLRSADGPAAADEAAMQALLEEAGRSGEAELLEQLTAVTTERVAADVATDLQMLFEPTDQGSELLKTVRVELAMTPQMPTAQNVALTVKVTTKLFTPATAGDTELLTSDSRSLRSSALLLEGRTLVLGGLIANADSLRPAKQQGKRRELLVLITPQLIE